MDDIKEMLVKLMEGQESMKIDMGSRFDRIENRLVKIELTQESIITKIDLVVEVQTAHKEQIGRVSHNTDALIDEKIDLIETSLKSVSKDVVEVKESVDVIKDVTDHQQIDIEILKRRVV